MKRKCKSKIIYIFLFLIIVVWMGTALAENKRLKGDVNAWQNALQEHEEQISIYQERIEEMQESEQALQGEIEELQEENYEMEELVAILTDKGNGVEANGQLAVHDGKLISEAGDRVVLHGMSSHGIQWYPEYINASAMASLKKYGANVFRIAMYTAQNGSYTEDPKQNKIYMYQAIENVLSQDMYAIVDWHVLRDENPLKHMDEAITFFDEISSRYADEEGVIYEICNEPNGDTTWEDITEYADVVIPTIRKNSPNAVIIVGVPRYSREIGEAMEAPLRYENIMYAYHKYIDLTVDGHFYSELLDEAVQTDFPVFISEWGISYGDIEYEQVSGFDDEDLHWEAAYEFVEYMAENEISWCGWALSNATEDHSFIKNTCNKLSRWTVDDLTLGGLFMYEALSKSNADK